MNHYAMIDYLLIFFSMTCDVTIRKIKVCNNTRSSPENTCAIRCRCDAVIAAHSDGRWQHRRRRWQHRRHSPDSPRRSGLGRRRRCRTYIDRRDTSPFRYTAVAPPETHRPIRGCVTSRHAAVAPETHRPIRGRVTRRHTAVAPPETHRPIRGRVTSRYAAVAPPETHRPIRGRVTSRYAAVAPTETIQSPPVGHYV